MTTIVPQCQKCDSELEVSRAYVTVDDDCFLLYLATLCTDCGAEWEFRWTIESLVKWAYDNHKETADKPTTKDSVFIADRKGTVH